MSLGPDPSWMFDFAGTVLPIFFVVMIGIVAISAGRGLLVWSRNNRMPVLTVPAHIVSKRSEIRQKPPEEGNVAHTTMIYYLTFEFDDGERVEFKVNGSEYGISAERDRGRLTYQGTRYHGFKREPHYSAVEER
ncbi:DUF2500 domain-containing protein [Paenibacillus rhizophilus]|uniref:DUF2500 domain-containing protein n=1 Tax=Paenibacillus rhizophilus TaxID=1850366 RepID=UPI00363B1414